MVRKFITKIITLRMNSQLLNLINLASLSLVFFHNFFDFQALNTNSAQMKLKIGLNLQQDSLFELQCVFVLNWFLFPYINFSFVT